MAAKRVAAKTSTPASSSPPLLNLALMGSAIAYGVWLLVSRGRMSWPPGDLLANAYTLAGCLALIGPIVLLRRDAGEGGVGEMVWLTAGVLVWIFDLAGFARGESRPISLATPVGSQTMGMVILAVIAASWRLKAGGRSWAWTNVTGWLLGVFWVALGLATLLPGNPIRLASL